MEIDNNGVIYKITNLTNGKVYIGKTKEFYGKVRPNAKRGSKLGSKFGIEGRFKRHIYKASIFDSRKGRSMLYNAIRKYGQESFIIEKLLNCPIDECNENEIRLIAEYNSTDPTIGYNIQKGGTGYAPKENYNVSDDVRMKMSESHGKNPENMNINPVYRKNILVGYKGKRRLDGVQYEKIFSSTKFTLDQNREFCKQWTENMKRKIFDSKKENAHNMEIPKNISYLKNKKGVICGYRMNLLINGIRYDKSFQEGNDMKIKLAKAIEYKNQILNIK